MGEHFVTLIGIILILNTLLRATASPYQRRLDAMEDKIDRILDHLGLRDPTLIGQVREMLTERQKIHAIKLYREKAHVDLREAKRVVDRIEVEMKTANLLS